MEELVYTTLRIIIIRDKIIRYLTGPEICAFISAFKIGWTKLDQYRALANTNIGYLHTITQDPDNHIHESDKQQAIKARLNPVIYMSELFSLSNAKKLLKYMKKYGIVLSGSRAAGYFNPSLCSSTSDWDFYIPYKVAYIPKNIDEEEDFRVFSYTDKFVAFLQCLGAQKIDTQIDIDKDYDLSISGIQNIVTMQIVGENTHTIQIISHDMTRGRGGTVVDIISGYDISALQCIISGYCAISMYHPLTKDSKAYWWKAERMAELKHQFSVEVEYMKIGFPNIDEKDYTSYISLNNLNDRLVKYINRGVHIIYDDIPARERCIGDSESFIVDFKEYELGKDDKRLLPYTSIKWQECSTSIIRYMYNRENFAF